MIGKVSLVICAFCAVSTPEPSPQFYPGSYSGPPFQGAQEPAYSGSQPWQQNFRNNFTNPNTNQYPNPNPNPNPYLNPTPNPFLYPSPNPQAYPDPLSADSIPNQFYGIPPSSASGYPQIYKIDNLIIIANPPQQQPQPCVPQPRPPPLQFPNPRPSGDSSPDDLLNRLPGDEPSKCTWAIVACCSPDNLNVRYNCFELLGCPGFFFDNTPCEPKIVMAAANAALEFYRNADNGTASTTPSGTKTNRI